LQLKTDLILLLRDILEIAQYSQRGLFKLVGGMADLGSLQFADVSGFGNQ